MFKKKKIIFIILFFCFAFAASAGVIDDIKLKISQKEAEIKELEEKAKSYKETVDKTRKEKNTLANRLKILDTEVKRLSAEIGITQNKIFQKKLRIEELLIDIDSKEFEIKRQKNNLSHVLRIIYENDFEPKLITFLKHKNMASFFSDVKYLVLFQGELSDALEVLKNFKTNLETEKNDEAIKKQELSELEAELEGKNEALKDEQNEKKDILAKTKKKESKYQALLSDTQKKREEIQKEIFELEDKLRLTIDPESLPKPRSGFLAKPTNGVISQGYGPTSKTGFINHAYKFHNGIDFAGNTGQLVVAADDGRVIATGNNGNYAYGRWIAIDHGNNLISLYAHLSSIKISTGDTVSRGQLIGLMGSTGFSTGPHLHFSVFAGNTFRVETRWFGSLPLGGSIDPMQYL